MKRSIITLCALLLSQAHVLDANALDGKSSASGRIYFIRHSSILSSLGKPDIRVDGKLVGELRVASYIVVDRPAGPHTITVVGAMDSVGCEAEIRVQPGMSHYFEMGPVVITNADAFRLDSMGITGRPLGCRNKHQTPHMFYSLDAATGAAAVAKVKKAN